MIRVSLVLLVVVVAGVARAQAPAPVDERAQQAKQHYETGMAHFQLEEWDKAIEEWQAGFRAKPVPQFLYNIAQAYRQSKRPEKALSFYQKYLRMEPEAANRAEVEHHIAQLKGLIEQQSKTASQPPTEAIAAEPKSPSATTTPPAEPRPPVSATPSATPEPTATPSASPTTRGDLVATAPAHKPVTKQGWFWGVIGGAGALVVAGVVVAVVLTTADSAKTLPTVRF